MAKVIDRKHAMGTSFHGVELLTSAEALKKTYGKGEGPSGDRKDKFQWTLRSKLGFVFTIYDHARDEKLKASDSWDYHIGTENEDQSLAARNEIVEDMKAAGAVWTGS